MYYNTYNNREIAIIWTTADSRNHGGICKQYCIRNDGIFCANIKICKRGHNYTHDSYRLYPWGLSHNQQNIYSTYISGPYVGYHPALRDQ